MEEDFFIITTLLVDQLKIREGFKKSKWKFKMAFAMKGGGHIGPTLAPEAILFESPCRAHSET